MFVYVSSKHSYGCQFYNVKWAVDLNLLEKLYCFTYFFFFFFWFLLLFLSLYSAQTRTYTHSYIFFHSFAWVDFYCFFSCRYVCVCVRVWMIVRGATAYIGTFKHATFFSLHCNGKIIVYIFAKQQKNV